MAMVGEGSVAAPSGIQQWERIEEMRRKLRRKIDLCVLQMRDNAWTERDKGLRVLQRLLATLTDEERTLFAIAQRELDCNVQDLLFQLLKKRMSPTIVLDSKVSIQVATLLDMLQGVTLLHYDSKLRAGAKHNMMLLLTFLPSKDTAIAISAIEALQSILIDSSQNLRIFETIGGLPIICKTLKLKQAAETVLHKCIELLCLYLQPEDETPDGVVGDTVYRVSIESKQESLSKLLGTAFVRKLLDMSTWLE
ncbi:hypothetical protein BASA61_002628 [Batrachochytrium salamandrivorans]|nr:hypothetical protein BASA62_009657 [Batrachochytrium salamandrivorans]KAH6574689.1 hypothetical protein BASA60_005391 [Batrachochytrium salamandrivorans]KAH6599211.1 hypothetical protein BASA61_002628 [Batrachochytrium salamandrivorans]KAH9269406.1 hypothetical protein BASA83_008489 [Batrachochytrium salamandrivorans]KAJ1341886.1 hypothetical protein BSLG_003539 [Batrachochytrium salamandrivorans]